MGDNTGSSEEIREISGPDIITAINSAGEVAGSLNNIGVTLGGVAYGVKKGLDKIKGDKDNRPGTGDASDKE